MNWVLRRDIMSHFLEFPYQLRGSEHDASSMKSCHCGTIRITSRGEDTGVAACSEPLNAMAALSMQRCSVLSRPANAGPCLPISRSAARSTLSCSASSHPTTHEHIQVKASPGTDPCTTNTGCSKNGLWVQNRNVAKPARSYAGVQASACMHEEAATCWPQVTPSPENTARQIPQHTRACDASPLRPARLRPLYLDHELRISCSLLRRAFSTSLGMAAASLLATQQASAATEVMQLADRDARIGVVALLFLPVLGWVAFNIGGPALNQLSEMSKENVPVIKSQLKKGDKNRKPKRGIVAAVRPACCGDHAACGVSPHLFIFL